ncbi:MAG: chemotaxis response regulator protein-glutamate methylesterase [Spirochaetes bacterium]|nr:chemotaxis response regulator protein-glutamate methylesterase [Spirochaetota bacterium]
MERIKVLIVDDSAVIRKILTEALSRSRYIDVVGSALDPYIAVNKIQKLKPDVLTLDIEMPRMDGLTFLSKLMISSPMPVIMVSSFTDRGADNTVKALSLGAVDFVLKPNLQNEDEYNAFSEELVNKVIAASKSKIKRNLRSAGRPAHEINVSKKYDADVIIPKKITETSRIRSDSVIAIGASTGGTEVIAEILCNLSEDVPGIVIAQHMPEKFTRSFADRINGISKLYVKEAEDGDRVYKGTVFIAPGGKHMLLKSDHSGYKIEINDGPPVNRHKPSVDVLFRSFAQVASRNSLGIILTGMGNDGAKGLLEIKESGISTIAQDEASSIIFGMPAEAIKLGAADMIRNIEGIISQIVKMTSVRV